MNRRNFIKRGALWVPTIFVPRLIHAQVQLQNARLQSAQIGTNSASAWTPNTDPNVTQWWSAGSLSLNDGDPLVTTWPAAKGVVGTCADANRPVYHTVGVNGLPYVTSITSGNNTIDASAGTLVPPFAVTIILRVTSGSANYSMPFHDDNHTAISYENAKFAAILGDTAAVGVAVSLDTDYMLTWVQPDSTPGNAVLYLNRVDASVSYSDSSYTLPSSFQLFHGDSGANFNGQVYEIIFYAPASRSDVEAFFNAKYGGVF